MQLTWRDGSSAANNLMNRPTVEHRAYGDDGKMVAVVALTDFGDYVVASIKRSTRDNYLTIEQAKASVELEFGATADREFLQLAGGMMGWEKQ